MTSTPLTDETDRPTPPRYRWLVRLTIAYALLIAVLGGGWFAWNAYSWHVYHGEIARLESLGQWATAEDFNRRPAVPASQNAATFYNQAFALLPASSPLIDDNIDWSAPIAADVLAGAQNDLVALQPLVTLATKAGTCSQVNWGIVARPPLLNGFLPNVQNARELCRVLTNAARLQHLEGDDGHAITNLQSSLHLGTMQDRELMSLLQHLVAVGMRSATAANIIAISGDLKIGQGNASRQQMVAMITDLLNDESMTSGFRRALQGEQAFQLDLAIDQSIPRKLNVDSILIAPAIRLSAAAGTRRLSEQIDCYRPNDRGKSVAAFDLPTIRTTPLQQLADIFEIQVFPSARRVAETQNKASLYDHAAAALLAIRWYQIDHCGVSPATLKELVPNYLPAEPTDPYAHGQPLKYLASTMIEGVSTPVVYSVGEDGVDNHASIKRTERIYSTQTLREDAGGREDIVYPLHWASPTTQPASE